ncbi:MAG TPA: DUF4157 domain-containing protein [Bacteroidia bacterium]|nr:DUF4157 domain-containing protein [Bacteroidia bacterium]
MGPQYSNTKAKEDSRHHDDWDEVHNQLLEVQQQEKVQKKSLATSEPGDSDEKEADEVARKVMGGASAMIHGTGGTINRKGEGSSETTPEFQSKLSGSKGGGQSLDDSTRSEMESKMGADFGNVKVHTGGEANQMSENINAKAFTHGQDIYFKDGQHNTSSSEGKELLAHELVHTVQQKDGGVSRKIQRKPGDPQWENHTVTEDEKSIYAIALKLRNKYAPVVQTQPAKEVAEISNAIIAHNHKTSVVPGDTIEIPTKAYFEGLGSVADLKKTDITMHGGSVTSAQEGEVLFQQHFEPGSEKNYQSEDGPLERTLINRTHFANVDPLLEPYLKNLVYAILISTLNEDTSITVRVDFTQMGFTDQNFIPDKNPDEKRGALEEIKTDRMYRITNKGEDEKQHIYIEGLGPVKTVTAQKDPDFLLKNNISFVDSILMNKKEYPDMETKAWDQLESDEKTQVTGAFLKMPDAVLKTISGLRIGRAEMSQDNAARRKEHFVPEYVTPDTLAEYFPDQHVIIVYDEAFKNSNTVLGDATAGTASYLESIIMHEIGHAEDMVLTQKKVMATPAYQEFSLALAEYRKVQDDADKTYLPKMKAYLDKKAELDLAKVETGKSVEQEFQTLETDIIGTSIGIDLMIMGSSDEAYVNEAIRIKGTLMGVPDMKVPPLIDLCRTAAQTYDTSKLEVKEKSLRKETLAGVSDLTIEIANKLVVYTDAIKKEEALLDLQIRAESVLEYGIESEPDERMIKAFPDAKLLLQLALKHHPDQLAYKAALSAITPGEDGKPDGEKLKKLKDSIEKANTSLDASGEKTASGASPHIFPGENYYNASYGVIAPEENMDSNDFQKAVQSDFGDYKTIGTEDDVDRPTTYGEKNLDELYAESFMLYFSDPERFAKLRPHLYMYFEDKYHRWEGKL